MVLYKTVLVGVATHAGGRPRAGGAGSMSSRGRCRWSRAQSRARVCLRASAHEAPRERGESDLRRLLVYLLDAREEPIVVLDATGRRVASNRAALDMATPGRGNARDAKAWSSVSLEGTDFELWVKDLDANEARDEES